MPNSKKDNFSIFKGIGIILMVIGHSGCPDYISNYIYLFHMALFYWVSGYFFNEKYLNNAILFMKQKIKGLYIPFVKYSLMFLFLHNIFYNLNIYNETFGYKNNVSHLYHMDDYLNKLKLIIFYFSGNEQLLGAFWFLRSLFIANVLFFISIWLSKKISSKYHLYIHTSIIISYIIISYLLNQKQYILPLNIGKDIMIVVLLHLGYLTRKYCIDQFFSNKILIASSTFAIGIISIYYKINIVEGKFGNPFIFLLASSLGCIMTLGFASYLEKSIFKNLLLYVGNNTMVIMAFHFLAFKLVSLLIITLNNLNINLLASFPVLTGSNYYWLLYSIIGVSIPICYNILSEKVLLLVKSKFFLKNIISNGE